jgi:electron transfer flavoprotein alpha subunit
MIAVVVVRAGQLPAGGAEAVAECAGRAVLVGSGLTGAGSDAVADLAGIAVELMLVELGDYQPAAWAHALAPLLAAEPAVLLPGSPDGRDLAPRLAALLHRPLFAGATSVGRQRIDLARNGGRELHTVAPGPEFVATLQPGVRGVVADPGLAAPTIAAAAVTMTTDEHDPIVLEVQPPDPATIDLAEAPRIIGGGAGLDGRERIAQLERISTALGASMGATRVITDRGWVPHERQIGTTGVVVDPQLYLAFGVSGAVQHTSGLGNPDHIISVNTDQHCPMMQLADLAIVADANATLTALEALLVPAEHEGAA